jgi:hypothetical protein
MKDFILKAVYWLLIVLSITILYSTFCNWFFAAPQFLDDVENKRSWCLKRRNEHYDFAVLGSSRAYGSFDMTVLNNLVKKKGINLGANGSGYIDNFLTLYEFLKNGNTAKVLYLQVDIYSLSSAQSFSNAFHTYQYLPYWNDPTVQEGVQQYLSTEEKIIWKYIPAIRYFKYNKYFSPKEAIRRYKLKNKHKSPFDIPMGGIGLSAKAEPPSMMKNLRPGRKLDNMDILYLKKIISLCRQNKIEVITYKAPESTIVNSKITDIKELYKSVDKILDSLSLVNIKPDPKIECVESNFTDPSHLSQRGRKLFTLYFASKANELYQLNGLIVFPVIPLKP